MRTSLPILLLDEVKRSTPARDDEFRSPCCCARRTSDVREIAAPASKAHVGRPLRGAVLTLVGMLGWLCVPKCPLCLATYVAIGSGITLSFAQSQVPRQLLFVAAACVLVVGGWRLGKHVRQFIRAWLRSAAL
jgi:hypothetical protein